jgi:hypothetical protein
MIYILSQTGFLAGMMADESADCRQGIDLTDQFECLFKLPFCNEGHIAPCILMDRAGLLAGGKRGFGLRSFPLYLSSIEGSSETLFFQSVFGDEFGRASPDTNITALTL